jgi:hypothetical protein
MGQKTKSMAQQVVKGFPPCLQQTPKTRLPAFGERLPQDLTQRPCLVMH